MTAEAGASSDLHERKDDCVLRDKPRSADDSVPPCVVSSINPPATGARPCKHHDSLREQFDSETSLAIYLCERSIGFRLHRSAGLAAFIAVSGDTTEGKRVRKDGFTGFFF